MLALSSALLYSIWWLSAQWFYGRFGVSPEEIGVTTVDLLLGAGVVALLILSAVLLVDVIWRRLLHPVLRVPALGLTVGGLASPLLGTGGVTLGIIAAIVGAFTAQTYPESRPRSGMWLASVTSLVVLGLGIMSFGLSDQARTDVINRAQAAPAVLGLQ